LLRIKRVAYHAVSGPNTVHKPWGVKRGHIGAAAGADDHFLNRNKNIYHETILSSTKLCTHERHEKQKLKITDSRLQITD
jgi:hypothetical protein